MTGGEGFLGGGLEANKVITEKGTGGEEGQEREAGGSWQRRDKITDILDSLFN